MHYAETADHPPQALHRRSEFLAPSEQPQRKQGEHTCLSNSVYRGIEKFLNIRKRNDLIEFALNLGPSHPEDRAIKENVFAPCELRMKSSSYLQKARNPSFRWIRPSGWFGDAAEDLQQRGFARAVAPNDTYDVSLPDLESDISKRPEIFRGVCSETGAAVSRLEPEPFESGGRKAASRIWRKPSPLERR